MTERDHELFEAELRRLRPAPLPEALQARLEQARPGAARSEASRSGAKPVSARWWGWLRWLAPAAAMGAALVLIVARTSLPPGSQAKPGAALELGLNADEVVIDRTLLSSFDTVATLPDGEPIRLRCREWLEAVTLRDSARSVEVQQRTPRLEIVPVALETY